MKAPFRWAFPIVAAVATVVAIAVDTDETVALPAATVAVTAAALALWDSVRGRSPEPDAAPSAEEPLPVSGSEEWFRSGVVGQEAIILLLDRIDRALVNPELPNRQAVDLAGLSGLPREQFLEYIEDRIAEIEAAS